MYSKFPAIRILPLTSGEEKNDDAPNYVTIVFSKYDASNMLIIKPHTVQRYRRPYTRQAMKNLHILLYRDSSLFRTNVLITYVFLNIFGGWVGRGGSAVQIGSL